ncbi:hypothetical protein [Hymenobacter cellulosilyticus]|uniref:Uncharacterized protein n=1 Tax=Hymenobacter cellulosilyticus TaxID=2932248 RepID=A0A8T9Q7C7_9BACT|nr:hypothetical protein [Hymenobacter cellulosilyticus]UOQ70923.1 hypothetical protein MUN79_19910 [Hymenobacter cellulosilyticus]
MAYKARESDSIIKAQSRLNGLRAIDPSGKLDLGNGHTIAAYEAEVATAQATLTKYNEALKMLAGLKNSVDEAEKKLDALSSAMLTAVGLRYTKDSTEYEQVGGVRTSDRQKPGRKVGVRPANAPV